MVFKNILLAITQTPYSFRVDEDKEVEWMTPLQMNSELRVQLALIRRDSPFFKKVLRDKYYALVKDDALSIISGSYFLDFEPKIPSIAEFRKQVITKVEDPETSQIFGCTLDSLVAQTWRYEKGLVASYRDNLQHAHLLYDLSISELLDLCDDLATKRYRAKQDRDVCQTGLEYQQADTLVRELQNQFRVVKKVISKKGL